MKTEHSEVTIVDIDITIFNLAKIWMNVLVASIPSVLLMTVYGYFIIKLLWEHIIKS